LLKASKRTNRSLQRIRQSQESGDEKQFEKRRETHLRSFDTRYVAADTAKGKLKNGKGLVPAELKELAAKLDLFQSCEEPVSCIPISKPGREKVRPVLAYGPEHRTRQYAILGLLRATTTLDQRQYLFSGGLARAVREVIRLIEEGFIYFVELDIKDFYPSVNEKEAIKLLPVPFEVGMLNLTSCHLNIVRRTKTGNKQAHHSPSYKDHNSPGKAGAISDLSDSVTPAAWQGIPQGAASSSYVTEVLLASVISALPQSIGVVSYADNILLLARTEEELRKAVKACGRILNTHPAGQFQPVEQSHGHVTDGLTFLGHQFRLDNGHVEVGPSPDNLGRYQRQFDEALAKIRNDGLPYDVRHCRADKISENIQSWRSSFDISNPFRDTANYWITAVEAARPKRLIRISHSITNKHIGDL